jgi:hypothetical protein
MCQRLIASAVLQQLSNCYAHRRSWKDIEDSVNLCYLSSRSRGRCYRSHWVEAISCRSVSLVSPTPGSVNSWAPPCSVDSSWPLRTRTSECREGIRFWKTAHPFFIHVATLPLKAWSPSRCSYSLQASRSPGDGSPLSRSTPLETLDLESACLSLDMDRLPTSGPTNTGGGSRVSSPLILRAVSLEP